MTKKAPSTRLEIDMRPRLIDQSSGKKESNRRLLRLPNLSSNVFFTTIIIPLIVTQLSSWKTALRHVNKGFGLGLGSLFIVLSLTLLTTLKTAAASSCLSAASGNWNAASTWTNCGGGVPGPTDSATIASGHIVTVTINSSAASLTINPNSAAGGNGITINTGVKLTIGGATTLAAPTAATTNLSVGGGSFTTSSLNITGSASANRFASVLVSSGTVTVAGNITFSGSAARARYISTGTSTTNIGGNFNTGGTLTTSGTGIINFNGSGAQTIGAYTTYNNVQINSVGTVNFGGTTTIGGTLQVNTGTLDMAAASVTIVGATTVNSNLRMSSLTGTKTFGDITIANGGLLNFSAAEAVTISGSLTINGTGSIAGTTGKLTFQKIGGGVIGGTTTATQSIAAVTFSTDYTNSIALTVTGTTTIGAGKTVTNSGTFTALGALSGSSATFVQNANAILNIGFTNTVGTLQASAIQNEVHYIRTSGTQTITGTTYYNLFIDESGQVGTLSGPTTVNGNLDVTAGALADGGFQITGNTSGVFSIASGANLKLGTAATATNFPTGFLSANINFGVSSTVNYNSNQPQAISNIHSYENLTLTATASVTKTLTGNITIDGLLTNGANNILADAGFTITVKDDLIMTGNQTGTGKILFTSGSAVHSISGTGSYHNVDLDDTYGLSQSGTTNISGTLTIANGSWSPGGNSLTVTGPTNISGSLTFTSTAGTKTFGTITINAGGLISFAAASAVTIKGDLIVNGSGTITGSTGVWTFAKTGGGMITGTAPALTILGNDTFNTNYSILIPYTTENISLNPTVNLENFATMTAANLTGTTGTFTQAANALLYLNGVSVTVGTLNASASGNQIHYTNTTTGQVVKATTYYHLFIDKTSQTGALSAGTTTVLGNLVVTSGTLTLGSSNLTVDGTTDIYGTLDDVEDSGSATFEGLVTVYSSGSWTGNPGEACDFYFHNGFIFNGINFTTGSGFYTFLGNNQTIGGNAAISVKNIVVDGIQLTNNSNALLTVGTALSGNGEFIQGSNANLAIGGTTPIATLDASASGNQVHYTNTTTGQIIKSATYYHLFVDEASQTGALSTGITTVLGNLVVTAGTLTLGSSNLTIDGTTNIYGTLDDVSNSGSATFGGLVTVYTGGNWTGSPSEAYDFYFHNGLILNGVNFTAGNGSYTFLANNQTISGNTAISIKNLVVNSIQLTNNSSALLTVEVALSGTGGFIQGSNATLAINGTTPIATLDASASGNQVHYTGSIVQAIIPTDYQTLDVSNNTGGTVTIAANTSVGTNLNLGSTNLSTSINKIILGASTTVTRLTGYVIGTVQKQFTADGSFSFPTGDTVNYTPIDLTLAGVSTIGSIQASVINSDHPDTTAKISPIDPNQSVNRYWTLIKTGLSFTGYNATVHFTNGDIDIGSQVANMTSAVKNSGGWTILPSVCAGTACSFSGTAIGDFQIGELPKPVINPPTITSPAKTGQNPTITTIKPSLAINQPQTTPTINDGPKPTTKPVLFDVSAEPGPISRPNGAIWPVIGGGLVIGTSLGATVLTIKHRSHRRRTKL